MFTPGIPGAINLDTLDGDEIVQLGAGAAAVQTTTRVIADLGGGSVPLSPFFGTALQDGWTRPGLDIGGSTPNSFTTWLNQGGQATSATLDTPGIDYSVGDTITFAGGTIASDGNFPTGTATKLYVTDIQGISAVIVNGGNSGTPGAAVVETTTGVGTQVKFNVTIGIGGTITSIDSVADPGDLTANLTDNTNEPVADASSSGITGAVFNIALGVLVAVPVFIQVTNHADPGRYSTVPPNPVSQNVSSGPGAGATFNVTWGSYATVACATGNGPILNDKVAQPIVVSGETDVGMSTSYLSAILMPIGAAPWTIVTGQAASFSVAQADGSNIVTAPIVLYDSIHNSVAVMAWGPAGNLALYEYLYSVPGSPTTLLSTRAMPTSYFAWFMAVDDGVHVVFYSSSENLKYGLSFSLTIGPFSFDYIGIGIERAEGLAGALTAQDTMNAVLWNWVQTSP